MKATSKDLLAPDWSINLDICDYVNQKYKIKIFLVEKKVQKKLQKL